MKHGLSSINVHNAPAVAATAAATASVGGSSSVSVTHSASVSSISPSGLTPSGTHHGLRSQLGHLLPKHALFQIHLHIEELTNVPLITGQFAVRWKFKNVHSGSGLFSRVKGHRTWSRDSNGSSTNTLNTRKVWGKSAKGKEVAQSDEPPHEIDALPEEAEDMLMEDEDVDGNNSSDDEGSYPVPSNHSSDTTTNSTNAYGEYLTASPHSTPVPIPAALPMAPASAPAGSMARSQSSLGSNASASASQSDARGATPWQKLQNYNVRWDHGVHVVLSMDVHRESAALLPSPLKLTVRQRVVAGDPDAPTHPRLGAVYLNLAEYVGQGKVERRYLLRQSKTNATLKVSIEIEHVGGEEKYVPPPLRKGEVLGSVAGILSNDLLRAQIVRELDEYTRSHSPSPFGVGVAAPQPLRANANLNVDGPTHDSAHPFESHSYPYPYATPSGHVLPEHLASSYGLHTTETLIEALFNPLPSSEPEPSPFTYYVPRSPASLRSEPARPRRQRQGSGEGEEASSGEDDVDSVSLSLSSGTHASARRMPGMSALSDSALPAMSSASGSASTYTTAPESESSGSNTNKAWWKKISRPGTPLSFGLRPRRPPTPASMSTSGIESVPRSESFASRSSSRDKFLVLIDSPGSSDPREVPF